MHFNKHSEYEGRHAFLSASSYHWLNYSEDKLIATYRNVLAKLKGTELHEFAAQCIRLGQKLPDVKKTLNMFVNDAIGYKMTPEQILFYSENCFGTADAISFRDNFLRIHDLKTGTTPVKMEQLMIYAALFCLEYRINPADIQVELRIYQSNKVLYLEPTTEELIQVINTIVSSDKIITNLKLEEG